MRLAIAEAARPISFRSRHRARWKDFPRGKISAKQTMIRRRTERWWLYASLSLKGPPRNLRTRSTPRGALPYVHERDFVVQLAEFVYAASIDELATRLGQIMLPSREVADAAPFANIAITGGVLSLKPWLCSRN